MAIWGDAIVSKKIIANNDNWQQMLVMIPYQLLTWRIVNPVSCAKDRFCSSDGYGCYWGKKISNIKIRNLINKNLAATLYHKI